LPKPVLTAHPHSLQGRTLQVKKLNSGATTRVSAAPAKSGKNATTPN